MDTLLGLIRLAFQQGEASVSVRHRSGGKRGEVDRLKL
jgi:hypothetical protein